MRGLLDKILVWLGAAGALVLAVWWRFTSAQQRCRKLERALAERDAREAEAEALRRAADAAEERARKARETEAEVRRAVEQEQEEPAVADPGDADQRRRAWRDEIGRD